MFRAFKSRIEILKYKNRKESCQMSKEVSNQQILQAISELSEEVKDIKTGVKDVKK